MTAEQDSQSVRELYNRTLAPLPVEELHVVEKIVKVNGVGTIIAILMSVASLLFTGGVVYGQVQQNSAKIAALEARADSMSTAIIRIDTNVAYLTDRAKEDRAAAEERRMRR